MPFTNTSKFCRRWRVLWSLQGEEEQWRARVCTKEGKFHFWCGIRSYTADRENAKLHNSLLHFGLKDCWTTAHGHLVIWISKHWVVIQCWYRSKWASYQSRRKKTPSMKSAYSPPSSKCPTFVLVLSTLCESFVKRCYKYWRQWINIARCRHSIDNLALFSHPSIVGYKEAFFEDQAACLCLVMDFLDDGDLY